MFHSQTSSSCIPQLSQSVTALGGSDSNLLPEYLHSGSSPMAASDISLLIKDPEVSNKTWTLSVDRYTTIAEVIRLFLLRRNGDLAQACQLRLMFGGVALSDELDRTLEDFGVAGARCLLHSMWRPSAGGCLNAAACAICQRIASASQVAMTPRKVVNLARPDEDGVGGTIGGGSGGITSSGGGAGFGDPASGGGGHNTGGAGEREREWPRDRQRRGDRGVDHHGGGGGDGSARGDRRKDKERRHRGGGGGGEEGEERVRLRDVVDRISRRNRGGGAAMALLSDNNHNSATPAADLILVLERLLSTVSHATDIVSQLERLTKLHKHGALTDSEYSRAKQHILFGTDPTTPRGGGGGAAES